MPALIILTIQQLLLNTQIIWMGDIYNDTEEYNRNKKCKIIIVFDNIIADMLSNKKLIQQ